MAADNSPAHRGKPPGLLSRLLHKPGGILAAVLIAVLAVSVVTGGWESAGDPTSRLAEIQLGKVRDAAPFEITIKKVLYTKELKPAYHTNENDRWVIVSATVTNTHSQTVYGSRLTESVKLSDVEGLSTYPVGGKRVLSKPGDAPVEASQAFVVEDASSADPLQPGITYNIAFFWEQSTDFSPPEEATVTLVGRTFRESSIDKTEDWFDPTPVARGTFSVSKLDKEDD